MALPAYHCTVIFQMASSGITTKVMTRSAQARLPMRGLRCEARRRPRPRVTLISTERLLIAAKTKSTRVAATRKRAATVNVGVSQSEEKRGREAFGTEEFSQMPFGLADRRDTFTDILERGEKKTFCCTVKDFCDTQMHNYCNILQHFRITWSHVDIRVGQHLCCISFSIHKLEFELH